MTEHTHGPAGHRYGPTRAGTVLLDLGAGTGALVLYTPADLLGAEIEISPAAAGTPRTHAAVRARPGPHGTRYAAVYQGLAAGGYTIWRDDGTPAARVTITGGQVTSQHWPLHRDDHGDMAPRGRPKRHDHRKDDHGGRGHP